jgi:hypothetical protein
VVLSKYEDKLDLCCLDTDSLIYDIQTENICEDTETMKDCFNFRDYSKTHSLCNKTNKKVIGKFRDGLSVSNQNGKCLKLKKSKEDQTECD